MIYVFKSKKELLPRICTKKGLRHNLLRQLKFNNKVWCDVFVVNKRLLLNFYVGRKTSIRTLMREITN